MAPGKDDPLPPTISDEERRQLWSGFMDKRRDALHEAATAALRALEATDEDS